MVPKLHAVTKGDLYSALGSDRCSSATGPIQVPTTVIDDLNRIVTQLAQAAGADVGALRRAQLGGAVAILIGVANQVSPSHWGIAVGFEVARSWLERCDALVTTKVEASWRDLTAMLSDQTGCDTDAGHDPVATVRTAIDPIVADPLTVFVAGPITGATPAETSELVDTCLRLRAGLVQLRVRLYSAPEEADSRVHPEFADDETWRDVDEQWIRRSDLVVILHPRAATGLGVVNEIAHGACVPVLLVADEPVTPMVARTMTPERLLKTAGLVSRVTEYIEAHRDQMLQRRTDVRAAAAGPWRDGRKRLRRDLEALSTESLEAWSPSTITPDRIHEVTGDDYAFGSLTEFERIQLRQAFRLPKIRPLTGPERAALNQAVRNQNWTPDEAWAVELSGRELLAEATGAEYHYVRPHVPKFWEEVRRGIKP